MDPYRVPGERDNRVYRPLLRLKKTQLLDMARKAGKCNCAAANVLRELLCREDGKAAKRERREAKERKAA